MHTGSRAFISSYEMRDAAGVQCAPAPHHRPPCGDPWRTPAQGAQRATCAARCWWKGRPAA